MNIQKAQPTFLQVFQEVVWVAWRNHVVAVCAFYEDAIAEVGDGDEGASDGWDVVVSAMKAGAEQFEAERNQRALHRCDGAKWDGFGAADNA